MIPLVPTDSANEKQHRSVISYSLNAVIKTKQDTTNGDPIGIGTTAQANPWMIAALGTGDALYTLDGTTRSRLSLGDTGAGTNEKYWRIASDSGVFSLDIETDARAGFASVMTATRSGTTLTNVSFPATTAASMLIGTSSALSYSNATMTITGASVHGAILSTGTNTLYPAIVWNRATSGNNSFIEFDTEGTITTRGSITYNRAGGLVAYNTTSDGRLKKNIKDSPEAGDLIDRVKVRSFDWTDDTHLEHWVVAQELKDVCPIAVTEPDDPAGLWGVDLSKLIPLLVKEVQSLRKRVNVLEAKGK
jgi:hypothetical protein